MSKAELLAQLAEEAAELSQAALKLRRALSGDNPTPVGVEEATARILEEAADTYLCFRLAVAPGAAGGEIAQRQEILDIMEKKQKRWAERLLKNACENGNGVLL